MTDFKAKMHEIRFRLGLRPRPRWRSLQLFPRPPSWIWGPLRGRGERLGWGRGGRGEGKGREGKWRGGKRRAPKLLLNQGPSEPCNATALVVRVASFSELSALHWNEQTDGRTSAAFTLAASQTEFAKNDNSVERVKKISTACKKNDRLPGVEIITINEIWELDNSRGNAQCKTFFMARQHD